MHFGISNPVPSSHSFKTLKTLKMDILNYEPINKVTDRKGKKMKKQLAHFKLSENSIFIIWIDIKTCANSKKVTFI